MIQVFLGLGSNIGDRYQNMKEAILTLNGHKSIELIKESSIYETEPFGLKEQPDFLNMVIEINTILSPEELLEYIHEIEHKLGRKREVHWGPRTIDIDILLYGDKIIRSQNLQVPHPYLSQRLFVLVPLSEIYKGGIPGEELSIEQLIKRLDSSENEVKLWIP
ncbi:2-amino-4-hydroxy-6-hydroxymethyldihydropteridine diphosphokinase [Vulcanibacillus modesticaldus]|uniref:2-amino-4-hydroxy-6-hydroxymethyldihydropteridine diphosphokinase n=1 Tax=Vulcanibacillus modesticaldus TaxID=337097 RepID=A0A1D2YXD9_9BACI|nr:2-amino-4-hydroxy-6-hydroxymethyldihydropteridine diphosphokinase [Vulcanibacillus modesticaldus]OEG00320.1 2-amino-4-hydroxy-6-hydroxymethyldihydropteridine diphosphokinase [Vulcanibacillus modesticaldus]